MSERLKQRTLDVVRAVTVVALAVTGIAGSTGYALAQAPNIVLNGGFESLAVVNASTFDTKLAGSTKLTSWIIGGQAIDHIKGYWPAAEGSQSIDLDGNLRGGSISQTLVTQTGKNYLLRFKYSANPDRGTTTPKMTVSWGGVALPQYTFSGTSSRSNMNWKEERKTVTATSNSTVLSFTSNDTGPYGFALDDVRVTVLTDQTALTVTGPVSVTYLTTGAVTFTGGSGTGAVTFSAGASTGCSVSPTGTVSVTNASGTCVLTATKAADDNYNATTSAPFTVALNKANQAALAVTGPGSVTYLTTGTATANGGGTGTLSFSAGASTGCSVSGATVSVTNASGACSLTATKAGDNNYNAVTSAPFAVTLVKANQAALTVTGPTSLTYGASATPTASGGSGTGVVIFSAGASTGCLLSLTGAVSVTDASGTCVLTATKPADDNYNVATSGPFTVNLPAPLATPTLYRVAAAGPSGGANLLGRVDGASNLSITLQVFSALHCSAGVLNPSPVDPVATVTLTTDKDGYFHTAAPISGVDYNSFVAVRVTTPSSTQRSACLVNSADNDTWPNARLLTLPLSPGSLASDFIDVPGKSRWYMFAVTPGQRIQVALSGLPADYDLAVFKDIAAAFLTEVAPANTANPNAALTKLSAEFAPSAFSPSAFSPSAFSPSAFSPDAYSPSAFSPSAFSADVYSPSAFSPSAFSPSAFSPSAFSPSAFSPSAFSPSAFSPSAFSGFAPPGIDAVELAVAFSSAQTRSIIAVSATPGTGDESAVVNSWNNTGYFYVRVAGRAGASSTESAFTLNVTASAPTCNGVAPLDPIIRSAGAANITTVVLTDLSRVRNQANALLSVDERAALLSKLASIGTVVDVNLDDRISNPVTGLRRQADANPSCPYAKNLLAEEIKSIVDSYRASNPVRYVVIAGNDDVIPFFRYPDQSLLGPESGYVPPVASNTASDASLRLDYILSQDAYGSGTQISLRASNFPVPGLAVGRLVETDADMAGLIDAYIASPVVSPRSSLVTGYDFLADAANAVSAQLVNGIGATTGPMDTLITPNSVSPQGPKPGSGDPVPWTASDLRDKLLGPRHDVIFLAGHFSANSALAADFTTNLITTDLAASTTDFTNAIVFSAGCHSGYNIVDRDAITGVTLPLDWAQAFARRRATLIAGTGYQYGDTDFIEYSERLYLNFARQLRTGSDPFVSVGEALVKAKHDYLAATPDVRGIHEKALLEATLFGLPMLGVNMPGRLAAPAAGAPIALGPTDAVTSGVVATLGLGLKTKTLFLSSADLQVTSNNPRPLTMLGGGADVIATWLSGPEPDRLVVSNAAEPVLPLIVKNVTPTVPAGDPSVVLRGVGFRGGDYTDSTGVFPLTGAATSDLRAAHGPFVSPFFFPMRTWSVNYFGALAGTGGTSLLITPVQHRAENIAQGTSTRRQFTGLNLRLYYSSNRELSSLSDAPSIVRVDAQQSGGNVVFTAQVVGDPSVGVQEVWIAYTNKSASASSGTWVPLDLKQCVAPFSLVPECGGVEDSRLWKGTLLASSFTSSADILYGVQAVNGSGVLTQDDNFGAYYRVAGTAPVPTTLTLVSGVPSSAKFGDSPAIKVALSSGTPLNQKSVIVAIDGKARVGTTAGPDGSVTINVPIASLPGSYQVVASFLGDDSYMPSSASSATFSVSKATASLAGLSSTYQTKLTTNGVDQPLIQESVKFDVFSTSPGDPCTIPAPSESPVKTFYAITDYLGFAQLPATGLDLASGSYNVRASFAGNATYECATTGSRNLNISADAPVFNGDPLPETIIVGEAKTFTVSSASGQQAVTVALLPGSDSFCTLSGGPTYTLTATATGTCTLAISAGGTTTFSSLHIEKPINIRLAQALTFAPPASLVYLQTSPLPPKTDSPAAQSIVWTVTGTGGGNCSIDAGGTNVRADSGTGSCVLTAKAPGTAVYAEYNATFPAIALGRASQAITFDPLGNKTYGDADFPVSAVASSGLAVSFSSLTAGACAVSGNSVHIGATGTCTIAADQAGDANYLAATRVPQSFSVAPATTTTSLASPSANPAAFGQMVTLNATLSPSAATGAVEFKDGLTTFATINVTPASGGVASYTSNAFTVGLHPLTAAYSGNANYSGSTSATFNLTINARATTTSLVSDTPSADYGAPVKLTATVAVVAPSTGTPGGTVTFKDGPTELGTGTLDSLGKATFTTSALTVGTHSLTASYAGDANDAGSTSTAITVTINAAFVATGSMAQPRSYHTATLLNDGRVMVTGGFDASGSSTNTTEVYCPTSMVTSLCQNGKGKFSTIGTLPSKSAGHTATLLPNGKVLATGGGNSSAQLFDPGSNSWMTVSGFSSVRSYHTATLLGNGKILFTGGAGNSGNTLKTTILFNVATSQFSAGPNMTTARERHTATLLPNGKVLIAGGRASGGSNHDDDDDGYDMLNTAELYDPVANTFTAVPGTMNSARESHAAILLASGKVLVAGGGNATAAVATAQLYDPATNSWTATGSMQKSREGHTFTVLANGKVLDAGGRNSTGRLNSAELYDPAQSTFALVTSAMKAYRTAHTATLLPDGNVLVVGGKGGATSAANTSVSSAELYGSPPTP